MPDEYAPLGWGIVFGLSLVLVTYRGTVDEQAVQELHERIQELEEQHSPEDEPL